MNLCSDFPSNLEVNCLYYGCNFLVKLDNVNILQAQFEKFEERFRNSKKSHYDLKLPLFIIDCFSKLWKLWRDIPDLRQLIEESKFQDVFLEMLAFFDSKANRTGESSMSKTDMFCNTCGDRIELVNNDFVFSFDLHVQSPHHVEMATRSMLNEETIEKSCATDNTEHSSFNPSAMPVQSPSPCQSFNLSSSIVTPASSPASDLDSSSRRSTSIGTSLLSLDTKLEAKSSAPQKHIHTSASLPSLISPSNIQPPANFKLPDEMDPHCGACCRSISTNRAMITEHLKGQSHQKQVQLMKKCILLLRTQQYISLVDQKTFKFYCNLCCKTQMGTNCFVQHCKSNDHVARMREIAKPTS